MARFDAPAILPPITCIPWRRPRNCSTRGKSTASFSCKTIFPPAGRGQRAPVQLIVNGIDANRARLIQGYAHGVLQKWSPCAGPAAKRPSAIRSGGQRIWFNEGAISRNFLVPGLITLIMTLIGILLTALVMAREWERGTMEAILVTPLRRMTCCWAR